MEFNVTNLKANVEQNLFDQGLALYLNKKVNIAQLIQTDLGSEIKYTYPVPDEDGRSNYSVTVKLFKKENKYFMSGCLCKCYFCQSNKTICSHIVALCLILMDYLNNGTEGLEEYSKEYFKRIKEEKLLNLFTNNDYSNVKLRPTFTIDKNGISFRLYIMYEKEYIINNINTFLEGIKQNSLIKYGKRLEFVHNLDVFNNNARELIELLMISKLDYINKMLFINNHLFEKIINIYKDDVLNFVLDDQNYKVENSLIEEKLNILVDTKGLELVLPNNLKCIKTFDKLILVNKNKTNVIKLNNYEMSIVSNLIDNNYVMDISESEEFFFSNIYPKIKNIVSLSKEVEEQFPVYDVVINSYIDLNDSVITVKSVILEQGEKVSKEKLAVLSKVIYFEYELLLKEYGFSLNSYSISDTTTIVDFLHSDITRFKKYGEVYLTDKVRKANVKKTGKFNLGINYNLNLLELNIDSLMSNDELQLILASYRNKEKYVILKSNVIIEIDDDVAELSRIVDEYSLDDSDLKTPKLKPSYTILNLLKEENVSKEETQEVLNDFTNYNQHDIYPMEKINNVLRPYQLEAYRWLHTVARYGFGGLLADDMGLGKSLEILSLILSDEVDKPSIIISPMSLVYNWSNEITKWGNGIKVNIVIGSIKERSDILKQIDYNKKEIYLVSYDILKKDIDLINGEFRFVVIDEAQYIKNKNTKTAISVKKLDSQVRFALTGTPIENALSDLWSIFDFILPNYLSSYKNFRDEFETAADLSQDSLELLQKKVAPFILRRTKKDVLKDLPDKIEEVYYANLAPAQEKLYNAYLNKARNSLSTSNEIEILSVLTRLRQICVSPKMFLSNYEDEEVKIDLTIDLISKAINGGHKILLFSQFTSSFDILQTRLEKEGIDFYMLTGKTPAQDRVNLSNSFNTKDDVKLFLISLKAGGTGLNLYGADTVIHLDPWWNLSAEAQATDRAHRIGQKKVLNVIKIICANTIEEKVLQLQNFKAELSNKIIDDNQNKNKKLNIKDLEFLLS
ncbi:MAG: DEAD/DEAH box helicase [bacterium]